MYFWGVKSQAISSLCNWRLDRALVAAEGRRAARLGGDYGEMSLRCAFSFPHISLCCFILLHNTISFEHTSRVERHKGRCFFFLSHTNWLLEMWRCITACLGTVSCNNAKHLKGPFDGGPFVRKKICPFFGLLACQLTQQVQKKDNLAFLDGLAFSFYLQFFGAKQTLLIVGIRPPKSIYSTLKWPW